MTAPTVRTAFGADVRLDAPDPATIDIRDIARHLSLLNRFAGATCVPVNVASHSVHVARELARLQYPAEVQLWGLLHDAHEAYTGDVTKPMIRAMEARANTIVVQKIQALMDQAILTRFGLTGLKPGDLRAVSNVDVSMLRTEWQKWMNGPLPAEYERVEPVRIPVEAMSSLKAEEQFLKLFRLLDVARGPAPPRHGMMPFDVHGGK